MNGLLQVWRNNHSTACDHLQRPPGRSHCGRRCLASLGRSGALLRHRGHPTQSCMLRSVSSLTKFTVHCCGPPHANDFRSTWLTLLSCMHAVHSSSSRHDATDSHIPHKQVASSRLSVLQCLLGKDQDSTPLLLLDLIDLQAQQPAWDSRDMEESRAPFVLLPDPTIPERVFVRSASAAWSLCLTWLPALSGWMSEGGLSLNFRSDIQTLRHLMFRLYVDVTLLQLICLARLLEDPTGKDALTGRLCLRLGQGKLHFQGF